MEKHMIQRDEMLHNEKQAEIKAEDAKKKAIELKLHQVSTHDMNNDYVISSGIMQFFVFIKMYFERNKIK